MRKLKPREVLIIASVIQLILENFCHSELGFSSLKSMLLTIVKFYYNCVSKEEECCSLPENQWFLSAVIVIGEYSKKIPQLTCKNRPKDQGSVLFFLIILFIYFFLAVLGQYLWP